MKRFVHPTAGKVYIVGAGPGDPGLLTVRGLAYLRQAQVVVHDRLVHPALLDEVSPTATCIDVGKAPGRHPYPQSAINALLIRKASEGHMVVRLKGGDPFVFGRGGEECQALAATGVPFEVVPGVSSAIAVPAYAGIPVTHRAYTRAFTVITGRTCDADDTGLDWQSLARAGTLVILMGLSRLATIAERLIAHGRAPDTPVAVIQWGTTTDQTVVAGPLATIAEKARELQSPATIVVGEVVELRHDLQWFDLPQVTQTIEPDAAAMPYTIAAALTATACLSPS